MDWEARHGYEKEATALVHPRPFDVPYQKLLVGPFVQHVEDGQEAVVRVGDRVGTFHGVQVGVVRPTFWAPGHGGREIVGGNEGWYGWR